MQMLCLWIVKRIHKENVLSGKVIKNYKELINSK